ncbi:MAG: DUF1254 domain-containing protein, partial [Sinobacteraceae bacterium]|nr:DUF1254 domain-containing protein [Nevskiaceae bacterium]
MDNVSTLPPNRTEYDPMARRKHLLPIIGSLLPIVTAIPAATAQAQSAPVGQASSRILNDYIYGLTPVILRATRDIATAVPDQTTPGKAPINQFSYSTKLVTPQDQTIVRPNVDTLYT